MVVFFIVVPVLFLVFEGVRLIDRTSYHGDQGLLSSDLRELKVMVARLEPEEVVQRAVAWLTANSERERRMAALTLARVGGDLALVHLEPLLTADTFPSLDWRLQQELRPLRRWYSSFEQAQAHGDRADAVRELVAAAPAPLWIRLSAALAAADPGALDAPQTARVVQQGLAHALPRVRALALLVLAQLPREQAEPVAVGGLTAKSDQVRSGAATVLARTGGARAFEHLEPLLAGGIRTDLAPELQQALWPLRRWYVVVERLAQRGPEGLNPDELDTLLDPSAPCWIRLRAVQAVAGNPRWLAHLGQRMDLDALLRQSLEHPVPAVVHAAIKAQLALGGEVARRRLRRYLQDAAWQQLPRAWQQTLEPLLADGASRLRA